MALKPCHECGKDVSTEAGKCPHCGAKVKKPTGVLGWIVAIFFGFVVVNVVTSMSRTGTQSGPSSYELERQAQAAALAALKIEKFEWKKGGFDTVMIANFTLRNSGTRTVKDVEISCTSYGESGTRIDSNRKTIYEAFPAGKAKRFNEFNMGFQHSQAARAGCQVTDLVLQ